MTILYDWAKSITWSSIKGPRKWPYPYKLAFHLQAQELVRMQLSQTVLIALLLATVQCVQEEPIKHTSHHKRAESAPIQFSVQTINPQAVQIPIQLGEKISLGAANEARPLEAESADVRPLDLNPSETGQFETGPFEESTPASGEEEQDTTAGGTETPFMSNPEQAGQQEESQENQENQAAYMAPVQPRISIMTSIPSQKAQQAQQAEYSQNICGSQYASAAIPYTQPAYYQVPSSSQAEESTTALKFAFPPRRIVSPPQASRPRLFEINVAEQEQTQIPQQQSSQVQNMNEKRPMSKVPIIKEELSQGQQQSPCSGQAQELAAQTMMPFYQPNIQQTEASFTTPSSFMGYQEKFQRSVAAWYSYFMPSSSMSTPGENRALGMEQPFTSCISGASEMTTLPSAGISKTVQQMANIYNLTDAINANVTMLFKLERNQYEYQHAQQFCSTKSPGIYCYVPFACGSVKCLPSAMISCPDGVILRCSEGYSCSDQSTTGSSTGSSAQCLALRDLVPSTYRQERTPRLFYPEEESPAFEVSVGGRRQIIAPQRCLGPLPRLFDRMAQALERAKATIRTLHSTSSTSDQQLQILQGGLLAGRRAVRNAGAIISPQAIILGPREMARGPIAGRILSAPQQSPATFNTEQSAQNINPEAPEDIAFHPIQQQQLQQSQQQLQQSQQQAQARPQTGQYNVQNQPQFQAQPQAQAQNAQQTNQRSDQGTLENLVLGSPIVSSGSGKRDPTTRGLYAQGQQQQKQQQQQDVQSNQQEQIYPQQETQGFEMQQPYQFITGAPQSRPRRSFEVCRIY